MTKYATRGLARRSWIRPLDVKFTIDLGKIHAKARMILTKGLTIPLIMVLLACSSGRIPLIPVIDTPEYHVKAGEKMRNLGKIDSAFREFNRALELDGRYSPAHLGIGLAHAFLGEYTKGMDALNRANRYARGRSQEIAALVGTMRFYTIGGKAYDGNWLARVEAAFHQALLIADETPAPFYYMGMAYKTAGKTDRAAKMFYRVLELKNGYVEEAKREYGLVEGGNGN